MEVGKASVSSEPSHQLLGHPTPRYALDLDCAPSVILSNEHINGLTDQNNLYNDSEPVWTPTSSADYIDDQISDSMVGPSSQVLERIKPVESDSFGSAEEMSQMREEQNSTREYSLRQTYSFLNEMSSSGSQMYLLSESFSRKQITRTKSSLKITLHSDSTWSPPPKKKAETFTKYSRYGRPTIDESRRKSLEKNKLAAARCRINKKIQTENLVESAHVVVAANNRLRREVMDKMEEIQSLHTEVLRHVVNSGCAAPHELRDFLCSGEGQVAGQDDPAVQQEHSAEHAATKNTPIAPATLIWRRSEAPSPSCAIDRFKHAGVAYQGAERKSRTHLSEP